MENNNKQRNWSERLKESYRLSVIEKDSYLEIRSFDLSLFNIYIYVIIAVFLIGTLITCLIMFTPIKKLVPGYADVYQNEEFILLNSQIDLLETQIEQQSTYIDGLKNMLNGVGEIPVSKSGNSDSKELASIENSIEKNLDTVIPKALNSMFFISPVTGSVSDGFDPKSAHYGIDLVAPAKSPIKASLEGVVISAGYDNAYGNTITLQHAHNIITVYKHNDTLLKKTGDKVQRGDAIAIIGNTGTQSSGAHLHFEIWDTGKAVDPSLYIKF